MHAPHNPIVRWFLPLTLVALLTPAPAASQTADVILHGGTIYTLAHDQPSVVEAVAINDGKVIAAGSADELEPYFGSQTHLINLMGNYAVPGLVDAHAHLFNLGRSLARADLVGTASAQACVDVAVRFSQSLSEDEWVFGRGWDQNDWAVQQWPTKKLLDDAFGDRAVALERVDGHAWWVSSAALRAAGITKDTKDPDGGEIVRDNLGEPIGVLIDNAENLIIDVIPDPSPETLDRWLDAAMTSAIENGLTGVHEMGVDQPRIDALLRAEKENRLKIRVVTYLGGDEVLSQYAGSPVRPTSDALLRIDGVKLYADGALGSRGAALLEDYTDRPEWQGLTIVTPQELRQHAANALGRNFSVAIHAIGDRGNRVALDAIQLGYTDAREKDPLLTPLEKLRPRIEHVQVVHFEDFPRFAQLGVIPSVQPTHCTSDMPWAPERVGPERIKGAYAWRTLLDGGSILPLGSDFPVEQVSPFLGLYAAATRQTPEGTPPEGWAPDQRLTRLEALLGFTVWPAQVAGVPQWGRIVPGSRADFTVVNRDPLQDAPEDLLNTIVLATIVEGELMYNGGLGE